MPLQIPFPATPFISHPYKPTGCHPSDARSRKVVFAHVSQSLCGKSHHFSRLQPLSLASLFRTPFLCFQQVTASFPKNRGVGGVYHD